MKTLFICIIALSLNLGFSQKTNTGDYTYFSKYNTKLVSPETTQKHIFSLGTGISTFTTEAFHPGVILDGNQLELNNSFMLRAGIGYHYLFLKKKKLNFYKKERFEHTGFGIYANIFGLMIEEGKHLFDRQSSDTITFFEEKYIIPQNELRITYTNPFFSYRGKLFNFYFIHEYGLSIFRSNKSPFENASNQFKTYINITPLSIKFGTSPIYLKSTLNFAPKSKILQFQKLKAYLGIELQFYFYKAKRDEN